jgi:hypothetical protein
MDRDILLFKAAYYADLNAIKSFVNTKDDLQIKIPVKEGDYILYWGSSHVFISILDILNWAAYGFYEYIDRDVVCHKMFDANNVQIINNCINPARYYEKVMNCIEWICNKFSIINYTLKDYSRFRLLRHFIDGDENYLDENEIKEALQRGFKQIDLDLINEAEKGNGITCYALIKNGANYKIDPIDYSGESLIVGMLDGDLSFHFLLLISYLHNEKEFDAADCYDMLSSLYQVGVSNYILDIIAMAENRN